MHVSDYNFYNLYNMEIQYIVLLKIIGIKKTGRKEIGITGNYTLFDVENLIKETCWII